MNDNNDLELWLHSPIFSALGEDVCVDLCKQCPIVRYDAGTRIASAFGGGDRLYALLDGTARIYHRNEDDRELLGRVMVAPATFGLAELLHDLPFLCNIAAAKGAGVATIPRELFLDLLGKHPPFSVQLLHEVSGQLYGAVASRSQIFHSLEARAARLFLTYAEIFGEQSTDGTLIKRPLSKTRIAQALGSTPRAAARLLAKWRDMAIVERQGRHLLIRDLSRLHQLGSPTSDYLQYSQSASLQAVAPGAAKPRVAQVTVEAGDPSLEGKSATVGSIFRIGSATHCTLCLAHESVAPIHCEVFHGSTGSRYWIRDLSDGVSRTQVNDRKIGQLGVLHDGDQITLGNITLRFANRAVV